MNLPGGGQMGLGAFVRTLYREYCDDAVADSAAQLSYYFLFALFPLLFVLVVTAAYLPLQGAVDELMARLAMLMPAAALGLIDEHLRGLVSQPRPRLLTFGVLFTIWSATRGVDALRKALNLAYDVKESRHWVVTELLAVGMTVVGAVLALLAIAGIVLGGEAGLWLARHLGIETVYLVAWSWLRWPLTALLVMLLAAVTYYLLPDVKQKFKYITPGSALATLLWLLATWGFTVYAEHFGKYNITYGSIGGVVVLLTWLYISGFVFILGGEVNAILEHASIGGKAEGARAEGEAAPPPEARPSAVPPGAAKRADVAERTPGGASGLGEPSPKGA